MLNQNMYQPVFFLNSDPQVQNRTMNLGDNIDQLITKAFQEKKDLIRKCVIHLLKHLCMFIEQKDQEIDYFRKTQLILKVAFAKEKFKRETFEILTKYGQKLSEYPLFPLLSISEINYRFERLENIIKYNYTDSIQDLISVSKSYSTKQKEKHELKTSILNTVQTSQKTKKKSISKRKSLRKKKLDSETLKVLNRWLGSHFNNPYPNLEEREKLIKQTGLSQRQINCWINNTRRKGRIDLENPII